MYSRAEPRKHQVLITISVLVFAHLAEVALYAMAFWFMEVLGMGALKGMSIKGPDSIYDLFYFSIASYTTLGMGDIVPTGQIRLVAGIEALNGLVLIAWSSSFTYLTMERVWKEQGGPPA
jgi:hypothetical protein